VGKIHLLPISIMDDSGLTLTLRNRRHRNDAFVSLEIITGYL